MPKKKRRVPKDGPVWKRSSEEATLDKMPKFNAYACGSGPHGDAKYNRAKQKRAWQRELYRQETRDRGSLPYCERDIVADELNNQVVFAFRRHSLRCIWSFRKALKAFPGCKRTRFGRLVEVSAQAPSRI